MAGPGKRSTPEQLQVVVGLVLRPCLNSYKSSIFEGYVWINPQKKGEENRLVLKSRARAE